MRAQDVITGVRIGTGQRCHHVERRAIDFVDTLSILRRDEATLRALADEYGVQTIALALGLNQNGFARAGGELISFSVPDDAVEGDLDSAESNPFAVVDPQPASMITTPLITVTADDFHSAARRILEQSEDQWKRQAVVRSTETEELPLVVLYQSFREWLGLQDSLAGASLVTSARLDAISPSGAAMTVTYRGSIDQVRSELSARGMVLEEDADLGWVIRTR